MPYAISIGIHEDEFWKMTMGSLKAHIEGYKMRKKSQDELLYLNQIYTYKAVSVALANGFNKKSKAELFKEPLLSNADTEEKELTEEEIQKQRELFVMKLQAMQTNFELNHKQE